MSIGNSTMELETATKADAIKILAHTEWCDNEPYIRKKNDTKQYVEKAYLNSKGHLCQH